MRWTRRPRRLAAYQVVGTRGLCWRPSLARLAARGKRRASGSAGSATAAPLAGVIGRHWVGVGHARSSSRWRRPRSTAPSPGGARSAGAMLLTLILVVGVLVFETLMQALRAAARFAAAGPHAGQRPPKLPDVVARCVRVAVLIGVAVTVAESWVVEVLALASPRSMGPDHALLAHRGRHAVPGLRAVGAVQVRDRSLHGAQAQGRRGRRSSTATPRRRPPRASAR